MTSNQSEIYPSEQDTTQILIPAYGMGITDEEENRQVESFLKEHPELQQEVTAYRALSEVMLTSVPQLEPPAHLLSNLLQKTAPSNTLNPKNGLPAPLPRPTISFQRRYGGILGAAAAVLIVLIGINILSFVQFRDLRSENVKLNDNVKNQTAMLSLLASDDVVRFELQDVREGGGEASAVVLCHPENKVGLLQAKNFPPLSSEMAYQIWLVKDQNRISGGVFSVDESGNGMIVFNAPEDMSNYAYIGITPERAEGSDQPTTPPIARGALYITGDATPIAPSQDW